jgi:2',3'-cyclic-nucleotide 2'-phosphodiesterase / 3'-nucleotidase
MLFHDTGAPFSLASRLLVIILLAAAARAQTVTVSVLATTDMHGNLYPIDYFTDRPAARGLAKIATLIREARAGNPNTLLVDCGDTIQGSPLESVYQSYARTGQFPLGLHLAGPPLQHDPMMLAMNAIGYDMMTVGNHEFNFGLKNLDQARSDAHFPWISANIETTAGSSEKPFPPYLLKTVAGVKVAVIGLTTPSVPNWEKPENYAGYRFLQGVPATKKTVESLRRIEHPDLIVAAVHSGLERDPKTQVATIGQMPGENMISELAAQVPEIDAIVFGHTHSELAGYQIGKVLLVQPKNWAISLARLDFEMERTSGGRWTVARKDSRLIPVKVETAADEAILAIGKPYHEITERYLGTSVAESAKTLDSTLGRVEDTALMDAIQQVQLYYSKADVSFAALFNQRVTVPKGPVTVRQIAALYVYDNELYAIEGNGQMVKDALENAARYFISCQGKSCATAPLTNPRVIGFNYDMAEGVQYEIDLTRPEGDRVRNLKWKGRPLAAGEKLRIAVNNYRAAGSAGYTMFKDAKVLWQSHTEIRDLMIQYYTERKQLPVEPDNNWRVVPDVARQTLERQAMEEAKRAKLM